MDALRAADKAHARQSESPFFQRIVRRLPHRRMLRETEVIVRAHVQHRSAAIRPNGAALWCREHALGLVSARCANRIELRCEMFFERLVHGD